MGLRGHIAFLGLLSYPGFSINRLINSLILFLRFRFFYASSACIYPEFKQLETTNVSLKESDAWPAEVCVTLMIIIHMFFEKDNESLLLDDILSFLMLYSPKMLMVWRNLQRRSCASITTKILESSAALEGSITFTVLLEHGKVNKQAVSRLCFKD